MILFNEVDSYIIMLRVIKKIFDIRKYYLFNTFINLFLISIGLISIIGT